MSYFGAERAHKLTITVTDHPMRSEKKIHTCVSFDNEKLSPELLGWMDCPRYTQKGMDPVNDKAWRKYNRMEKELQKGLISECIARGFLPKELEDGLKFSRFYYCRCGCSPLWVKKDRGRRFFSIRIR